MIIATFGAYYKSILKTKLAGVIDATNFSRIDR